MRALLSGLITLIVLVGFSPSASAQSSSPFQTSSLRITLDLHDEPIRDVLTELARLAGVNMVLSDSVDGRVTAKFDGVPIDEAFEGLLAASDLGWCLQGDAVSVQP